MEPNRQAKTTTDVAPDSTLLLPMSFWQRNGDSALLLASGLTFGFLVGWALRGNRTTFGLLKPAVRGLAAVGKHLVTHGNVPNTKLVLVVRSDLQMTKGKIGAQCGHAAVGAVQEFTPINRDVLQLWLHTGQAKVVLKAAGEEELLRIAALARTNGLNSFVVRDAGRTEVEAGCVTVVAVGPAEVNRFDAVTGSLSLL
ncbi:putative Peptidyl-tRNA hydrolase 2, mitochondrial [Hypsibius exemplaris]|uniref:peptidyl-tRNA hydrolase n=1 Tax=Hypsibius exemplaris TaxID=2072580 RepID=A0A9X6RLT7_HYPEX|nr:putative Peptidyl-tRNA hydrolase 2, mitochondrial [Hypsibius exemplaris]